MTNSFHLRPGNGLSADRPITPEPNTEARIVVADGVVSIDGLRVRDSAVTTVLNRHEADVGAELIERMLAVGARGMTSMGLGVDLADFDSRVKASVMEALQDGRREVTTAIEELTLSVTDEFDPSRRASAVAKILSELEGFRVGLGNLVDPARTDSHTSALLQEMTSMLGPGGALEQRLHQALDPETDGSALASTLRRLEQRLDELHQAVAEQRGRRDEADRGTAKGFAYEDNLEERLREWARPLGAIVERTSHIGGDLGSDLVGDFVVELTNGGRIVVEAKNTNAISLNGRSGILAEMRRGMDNRSAQAAVCFSRKPVFPREVGAFGVYGDVVLAVDDLEGTMLFVAMTWASQRCQPDGANGAVAIDSAVIDDRIDRIRGLANLLSSNRRSLTEIVASVEKVRGSLDSIRLDLLEAASDVSLAMRTEGAAVRTDRTGDVVPLTSARG